MQNSNFFTKTRWLVTIILLLSLGVGNSWAADPTATFDFTSSSQWSTWGITAPTSNSTGVDLDDNDEFAVNDVTMTFTDGSSTVCRCWKATGGLEFRFYSGSTVTFSVSSSYKIKSVYFNSTSSMAVSSPTGGSMSSNTWTPKSGTSPTSVEISASGSAKWTSVTVTYEANASCGSDPTVTAASSNGSFL